MFPVPVLVALVAKVYTIAFSVPKMASATFFVSVQEFSAWVYYTDYTNCKSRVQALAYTSSTTENRPYTYNVKVCE